jgi:hypothetical protein
MHFEVAGSWFARLLLAAADEALITLDFRVMQV